MSALYIVATPIGNLSDISKRALDTLEKSDLILAEDSRITSKLLRNFHITTPIKTFHEHNEIEQIENVLDLLQKNKSISLVSDAGTPLISDPGFKLVREAIKKGFQVTPIPGASAPISALSASGLPTDKFVFMGFFPKKLSQKKALVEQIKQLQNIVKTPLIFFDSPYRINSNLEFLGSFFPDSDVVIAREMTKIHEEFYRGKLMEFKQTKIKQKGEITFLLY